MNSFSPVDNGKERLGNNIILMSEEVGNTGIQPYKNTRPKAMIFLGVNETDEAFDYSCADEMHPAVQAVAGQQHFPRKQD